MSAHSEKTTQIDVVVIGAGPTGENVADYAVRSGLSAVLVEASLVGGECSYYACMPTKALLRPGQARDAAARVDGAAQAVAGELDVRAVLARRDSFAAQWDDSGQVDWATGAGIDVVRGRGRIVGPRRVEVTEPNGTIAVFSARLAVVLATGSTPRRPNIPGVDEVDWWTTADAASSQQVPARLAVLGASVAGSELAQAFASLGSSVTLLARGRVLDKFPAPASELVSEALAAQGIDVRTGVGVDHMERIGGDTVLTLSDGGRLTTDKLLVAIGREPATRGLGLEDLGIDGFVAGQAVQVDDSGRVLGLPGGETDDGADWLYAAGDVTGRAPLTHQGKYAARVVGEAIAVLARPVGSTATAPDDAAIDSSGGRSTAAPWSRYAATADHVAVPQVVFTDPQIAHVGIDADAARADGMDIRVVDLDIAVAGSSLHADGYRGWARMVVDESRGTVVGVTFAGQDVAELLHSATVAIVGEVPVDRLWHAVPAYPTISEVWLRLLESYRFG